MKWPALARPGPEKLRLKIQTHAAGNVLVWVGVVDVVAGAVTATIAVSQNVDNSIWLVKAT